METLTHNLSRWTSDELIGEVVRRAAGDGQALVLVESTIIRARLAAGERRCAGYEALAEPAPVSARAGLRGTMEMGLANDDGGAVLTIAGHGVDASTPGAHTHDHTHRRQASAKFAAHLHHHLHLDDGDADAQFNGHSHASAHATLPWERTDPA